MKVKVPVLLLSTALGIFIFTIISFFIVWCGFPAENPEDSFKDALDFSGGIFSGATTFGAAIVAGFLFNDWRDERYFAYKCESINKVIDASEEMIKLINGMKLPLLNIIENQSKKELSGFFLEYLGVISDHQYYILNNINHLANVKGKGFSSEVLFNNFKEASDILLDRFSYYVINIETVEVSGKELEGLKAITSDLKDHINNHLITTLRKGLSSTGR